MAAQQMGYLIDMPETPTPHIGGLNEKSLHRKLKERYRTKNSLVEEKVGNYVVDVKRPTEIVEIQTGSFSGMKKKLSVLLKEHRVRLVHPVAVETIISTYEADGTTLRSSRRSPKKGCIAMAGSELLYLVDLLPHPNLWVEILLVKQEEVRIDDGKGSWRRKGISVEDRHLGEVVEHQLFKDPKDFLNLLPQDLPDTFGNREVAEGLSGTNKKGKTRLAGQITYLLRKLDLIEQIGKEGNRFLFQIITTFQ